MCHAQVSAELWATHRIWLVNKYCEWVDWCAIFAWNWPCLPFTNLHWWWWRWDAAATVVVVATVVNKQNPMHLQFVVLFGCFNKLLFLCNWMAFQINDRMANAYESASTPPHFNPLNSSSQKKERDAINIVCGMQFNQTVTTKNTLRFGLLLTVSNLISVYIYIVDLFLMHQTAHKTLQRSFNTHVSLISNSLLLLLRLLFLQWLLYLCVYILLYGWVVCLLFACIRLAFTPLRLHRLDVFIIGYKPCAYWKQTDCVVMWTNKKLD